MRADAGHEGKVRTDGLAREGDELRALFTGEEEGLCVGTHDDKAVQARVGQMLEVFGLSIMVNCVICMVEECD